MNVWMNNIAVVRQPRSGASGRMDPWNPGCIRTLVTTASKLAASADRLVSQQLPQACMLNNRRQRFQAIRHLTRTAWSCHEGSERCGTSVVNHRRGKRRPRTCTCPDQFRESLPCRVCLERVSRNARTPLGHYDPASERSPGNPAFMVSCSPSCGVSGSLCPWPWGGRRRGSRSPSGRRGRRTRQCTHCRCSGCARRS